MSATDYFAPSSELGRNGQRIKLAHGIGVAAGLAAAFVVWKFTGFGPEAAIFAALLIILMVWRSDPRWLFGAAIGSFGAIIIVSTLWRGVEVFDKPLSERMAIWSFYFLVIGVMLLIVESYWPKDGTFNALQQRAPSAAKGTKHLKLPAHIMTKLKHQREEQAAAQAAAAAQAKKAPPAGSFKHPLFANSQTPVSTNENQMKKPPKPKQPKQQKKRPEKPFQYIAQSPVKPLVPVQPPPKALPVPPSAGAWQPSGKPNIKSAGKPANKTPHIMVPQVFAATAPARLAVPATPQPFAAKPVAAPKNAAALQAPDSVGAAAARAAKKPVHKDPPLLDLRSAPRVSPASRSGITVSVKSDSPLPSKRRKLVQL